MNTKKDGANLVDEIYRLTSEELNVSNSGATAAIRRAGRAMTEHGEDYLVGGADLARFLISDQPIDRGARLLLAHMVLGELRHPPVKPELTPSSPEVVAVTEALDAALPNYKSKSEAVAAVAEKFSVGESTIWRYDELVKRRRQAIAKAKKGTVI